MTWLNQTVSREATDSADGVSELANRSSPYGWSKATSRRMKRALDIAIALAALVFFAPLMLVIAASLLLQDGRPVIFKQRRIGAGGRAFPCYKFRSMAKDSDRRLQYLLESSETSRLQWQLRQKLDHDPRIHFVGALLRKSSLDELPQLWNVLRGHMSIVGPRPVRPDELARYGEQAKYYLAQRPGLTGLWQVSGRSGTTYTERIELDVRYSKSWTLMGDIVILLKTVVVVLTTKGSC
jgi:lipopolysaccharide/colanic/teichoic acid biosynthesis glycosyltransferase